MSSPWVLVTGDVSRRGGQDRANYELARHLLSQGRTVHLVAHRVDDDLARHPLAKVHPVNRPFGSHILGAPALSWKGRRVAAEVTRADPDAHVLVNGGNCRWPDVNWVHCVHAQWPVCDRDAPAWIRFKNFAAKALARRSERRCLAGARVVLANSEKTRNDLIGSLGVPSPKIRVIPLGVDPETSGLPSQDERRVARDRLDLHSWDPVALFVGALGHDCNKGLDTLLAAWAQLCQDDTFGGLLLVAGGGRVEPWKKAARALGIEGRVQWLGAVENIPELQAAADLAIAPSRYEAFGLFVFESLCRGLPTLVSASAGVAEHYPEGLAELLLPNPSDSGDLARRVLSWKASREGYKAAVEELGAHLRRYTWAEMAGEMMSAVEADGS